MNLLPLCYCVAMPVCRFFFAMLRKRLADPDCVARGWLLDGFPHTAEQCTQLQDMGIVPDKVGWCTACGTHPRGAFLCMFLRHAT